MSDNGDNLKNTVCRFRFKNTYRPKDEKLYAKIKSKIYKSIPKHSAYRSGILVKTYKNEFKKKYGNSISPYDGKNLGREGLRRWFAERWRNQYGTVGYKKKGDVYRPTIKVSKKTPLTYSELTKQEIKKAQLQKKTEGRVRRFRSKTTFHNHIVFNDYPDFRPNLTPRDIFKMGSFGGTYWRPINSSITKKKYKNQHKKYPISWWKGINDNLLTNTSYDKNINLYKVKVGTSLSFWEGKGWITKHNPYGWVQWYCDFYNGKRGPDDKWQISRWKRLAGSSGRFFKWLVTRIINKNGKWNDINISPKIRQTLQHWGYKITKLDFDKEVKSRSKNK